MKPYYSHAGIEIFHGDCRDALPQLGTVDMVLTDPPYNEVNRESAGLRNLDRGSADSACVDIPILAAHFSSKVSGSIYVWCGTEQVSQWKKELLDTGFSVRQGIWHKSNPSPMNGEHIWLSAIENCVFGKKPSATFNQFCAAPVWHGPTEPDIEHPCAKPLWLFTGLILASSKVGDTVLDPFMGSGTTLIAAKNQARKAIGIEIEERWCEVAAERLSQEVFEFREELNEERV